MGPAYGHLGINTSVCTTHPIQAIVPKTLNPNAQPIEASPAPKSQARISHVFWINLQRGFGARIQSQPAAQGLIESGKVRIGEQAWGAAAPVQGAGLGIEGQPQLDLTDHGIHHLGNLLQQRRKVKIAVAAGMPAKGNVHINPQRRRRSIRHHGMGRASRKVVPLPGLL